MATNVLGLHTFTASEPWDFNIVNDNSLKIDNGVKTAMQGRAAHNLLDNSYFADLVAQAGLNGAHGSTAYIADRWKSSSATATQKSGYTTLSTTEKTGRIAQKLPYALAGKTVTAAAKVSGSSIVYCGVYYNQNSVSKSVSISVTAPNGIIAKSGVIPNDATDIEFRIYIAYTDGGGSCNVYWAALYEGSYTSDTLPAYVPKEYAAELAECQRYYVYINSGAWMTGFYKIGEGLCVEIPTAGNIRINNPTVILDNPKAFTGTGWNNLKVMSVSVNRHATKIVFDFVDPSAAQASYGDALIVYGIDSISADL